jgi:hypothetical protein
MSVKPQRGSCGPARKNREPEVRDWLEQLSTDQFARAAFYVDLLADEGPLLSEPYTRLLDRKLRELRFHLDRQAVRITYWIASGRRIVLLTVFIKTRMRENREIERCAAGTGPMYYGRARGG